VLPSFRDRYCAVLRPDRVDLVRRGRGLKPPVDFKQSVAVEAGADGAPWLPSVAALSGVIAGKEVGRGELTVVLSNHFVRYLIIPWNDQVGSAEEFERYARISFENVFGEEARTWAVRISPEKLGAPRLGSAIDNELLTALRQVGRDKLKLVSVQPYLMAAFNRLSQPFRRHDFFFLLAEPGRACALAAVKGHWRAVRNYTVGDEDAISALAERELRLLETDEGPVPHLYVHAPGFPHLKLPIVRGVAPRVLALPPLPGFVPDADVPYSMALAAA
jgi:hypothetical protein